MLCRKCGAEVSAGTPFCPRCGSTMEENYVNNNSYGNTQYSNQSYSGYENNSNGNMYGGQQRLNQPYTGYENNRNNYENGQYVNQSYMGQQSNISTNTYGEQYYNNQPYTVQNDINNKTNKKNKKTASPNRKKKRIITGVIISLVMLLIIVSGIAVTMLLVNKNKSRSSNDVVKEFIQSVNDKDTEKLLSLMPKEAIDEIKEWTESSSKEEIKEFMEDFITEFKEGFDEDISDDDDVTFTYKIIKQENDIGYSIKEINQMYKEEYGKAVHITAAKRVQADISYRTKDDNSGETEQYWFTMFKINDSWYLISVDSESDDSTYDEDDDSEEFDLEAAKEEDSKNLDEVVKTVKNCITEAVMDGGNEAVVEYVGEPARYYIKDNGAIIFESYGGEDSFVTYLDNAFSDGCNTTSKVDGNNRLISLTITLDENGEYDVTAEYDN